MKPRTWLLAAFVLLLLNPFTKSVTIAGQRTNEDTNLDDWFTEEPRQGVPQTEGELLFLSPVAESEALHSLNTFVITSTSVSDGWVNLVQCYEGLDAVPEVEVVYRYRKMRQLQVHSTANIGQVITQGQTVQLVDVRQDASLCVTLEAKILHPRREGGFVIRNGPYHRKFLDGYFPMHVSMDVQYPTALLRFLRTSPKAKPGFKVDVADDRVYIDTWFAGKLNIEVHFSALDDGL